MLPTTTGLVAAAHKSVLVTGSLPLVASGDERPFAALLFLAAFVSLFGVFLTFNGAAAYALLVWEGTAGVVAWVFVHPYVGAFLFAAAAFQAPLAAHIWGDPLELRRRGWLVIHALVVKLDER